MDSRKTTLNLRAQYENALVLQNDSPHAIYLRYACLRIACKYHSLSETKALTLVLNGYNDLPHVQKVNPHLTYLLLRNNMMQKMNLHERTIV